MRPINGYCSYCHRHSAFTWLSMDSQSGNRRSELAEWYRNNNGRWTLGECPNCQNCVLIQFEEEPNIYGKMVLKVKKIHPNPLPAPSDERIPENIRKDLDEAKICKVVNAFQACAAMCRRVIQTACISHGTTKNDLKDQIDELKEKQIITPQLQAWAHTVRFVGNDAVHPNNPIVTEEDAADILNLSDQILQILYIMPAIAKQKNDIHGKKK